MLKAVADNQVLLGIIVGVIKPNGREQFVQDFLEVALRTVVHTRSFVIITIKKQLLK